MSKEIIPSPGGSNKFSRLISKIKAALGIVEESNTATHAIAAGKYVTWKGDLYKAKSAISSGAALSSSNLEAVPDGGFNALSEQIGNKLVYKKIHVSPSDTTNSIYDSGVSTSSYYCIGGMLPNDDDIEVRVCAKNGTWQYTLWSISSGGKIGNNYNYWVHLSFLSRTNLTEIT